MIRHGLGEQRAAELGAFQDIGSTPDRCFAMQGGLRKGRGQSIAEFPNVGSEQVSAPSFRPVGQQASDPGFLKRMFD